MEKNHMKVITEEEAIMLQEQYSNWKEDNMKKASDKEVKFGYSFVFSGLSKKMKEAKLSANAIITYLGIMELANNEKGTMFMSNTKLSEITGIKGSTLSDAIKQLEDAGFIIRYVGDDGYGRSGRKIQITGY